jgi:hypothetical protein
MKLFIRSTYFVSLFFLASCKTKAFLIEGKAEQELRAETVIQKNDSTKFDFRTLYIKANARYEDQKNTQNVTAEIKIKKNEIILVSIRFLGITMAKAMITPTVVKYYEKINGSYFEGNYKTLSNWLGTDLDYTKVQNMLLAQSIKELKPIDFSAVVSDSGYKLESKSNTNNFAFFFESERFLLTKQQIEQIQQSRIFSIDYKQFQDNSGKILPSILNIFAQQQQGKTKIDIEYKNVTFDEELTFPYSVPEGYERISID